MPLLTKIVERLPAGLAQRFAQMSLWETLGAFGVRAAGALFSFALNFLIARHYGPVGTGGYALALTTGIVAGTLALVGLDFILLRTVAGDVKTGALAEARGAIRTIVRGASGIAIGVAIILASLGVPLILKFLGHPEDAAVLKYSALAVLPFVLTRLASAGLRATGSVVVSQWIDGQIATTLSLLAAGLVILVAPRVEVEALYICYVVAQVGAAIYGFWLLRRAVRAWPAAAPARLTPMLGQGVRISFVVMSMLLADWLLLLVIGAEFSTADVGRFRTAVQIAALTNIIVVTFDTVAGPRVAAAHRVGETASIRRTWFHSMLLMLGMSAPLLALCLIAPEWVLGLFGPGFVAAAPALRVLAVGQLINVLTGPAGSILIMTGRENWSLTISIGALVLLAVLGFTLVPAYGPLGAAITAASVTAFRKMVACWLILKR